jgi:hypothetical protein
MSDAATDRLEALADEMSVRVKAAYKKAKASFDASPDVSWWSWTSSGDYAARVNASTLEAIRVEIDKWSVDARIWARNGHREDGSEYTWDRWFDYGEYLATNAAQVAAMSWDSSSWMAAVRQSAPWESIPTTIKAVTDTGETAVVWYEKTQQKMKDCMNDPLYCAMTTPTWVYVLGGAAVGLFLLSRVRLDLDINRLVENRFARPSARRRREA